MKNAMTIREAQILVCAAALRYAAAERAEEAARSRFRTRYPSSNWNYDVEPLIEALEDAEESLRTAAVALSHAVYEGEAEAAE